MVSDAILIAKSKTIINEINWLKCYENKLLYGCTYNNLIEAILIELHGICMEGLEDPWWVELMD
jgi:hypothetical protein